MVYDRTALDRDSAERLLEAWLGRPAGLTGIQRLHGGMINSVLLLEFDADPGAAVVKLSSRGGENPFGGEQYALQYVREHSSFPVPEPYLCRGAGELLEQHVLLLEYVPGSNLGEVALGWTDRQQIDRHLAELLLELHSHTRDTFGELGEDGDRSVDWRNLFIPKITVNLEDCRARLPAQVIERMEVVLERLPVSFESQSEPVLVHGDIWATNVMVLRNGTWRVTGLVDPSTRYTDVEFELAYMEVFGTVTEAFFGAYCAHRPLREGYEVRRLYYWLDTMLRHVVLFGDQHYADRALRITRELERLTQGAAG